MPHTIDREGRSHAVIRGAAPIAVGGRFPDRPEPACTPLADIRRNRDESH